MSPMNNERDQAIYDLVTEYENSSRQGLAVFLAEKAYQQLIDYYEEEGQLDRALEVVDQAIEQYNYSVDFYLRKAHLQIDTHHEQAALDTLDEAALFAPDEVEIDLLRAEAFIYMNRINDALVLLEERKLQGPRSTLSDILLVEAMAYEHQEEYELMFYTLSRALRVNPKNEEALERVWLAVELSKKYEESIKLHDDLLNHDAYLYLAWYNLGHAHAYLGNYEQAVEAYEFAYVINERFEYAYRDCAELCFEMKRYGKALKCFLEILELFEPDSELLLRIGQCYRELGNYVQARSFCHRAIKMDPLNDEVHFHMGLCYSDEKKWKLAVRSFRKALSIESSREEYYAALAEAFFYTDDWEKAEQLYRTAVDIAPEDIAYWLKYVAFLLAADRPSTALNAIEEAEEYELGVKLLYARVATLCSIGRRKEAMYWLGEALSEEYDLYPVLFGLVPELEQDSGLLSLIASYRI